MISLSLIRLAAAGDLLPQPPDARTVLAAVLVYQSRERTVEWALAQKAERNFQLTFDMLMDRLASMETSAYRNPYPISWVGPVL